MRVKVSMSQSNAWTLLQLGLGPHLQSPAEQRLRELEKLHEWDRGSGENPSFLFKGIHVP